MSPSTEAYDRGEKLEHYQQIASLHEIVLIAHDQRCVEVIQRSGATWSRSEYRSEPAALKSLSCTLPLDDIYRDPLASSSL
jgi:Uma2 family endonuclease